MILVTGAGGFIGSHVVEALLRSGQHVRALIRYNARDDWGHLAAIARDASARLNVERGDIRDPHQMRGLIEGCEIVLHLAALIGIPYSYAAPTSYVQTNITGTLNILEACREKRVKRVVITSTSEVYGTAIYSPIDENHPLQAQSPYSASKIAADKLGESYFRSFDLPVVTLRPFNTYGPRQSARAVVPTVLSQAISGKDTITLGNLEPKRDLTFVEDTARAFVLAATAPSIEGEVIHFGQGDAISIGALAEQCLAVAGSNAAIISAAERLRPTKSEVGLLLCDRTKAERLLGWKPQVTLNDGLQRTARYLRLNIDNYRTSDYVQ